MPDGSVDDHHVRPSSAPQSRRHAISVRPPHDLHARDAPESGKHAARERIGAAYEDRSAARQPGRGPPASEGPSVAAVPASGRGRPGSRHARAAIHCCACLLNSARVAPPPGCCPWACGLPSATRSARGTNSLHRGSRHVTPGSRPFVWRSSTAPPQRYHLDQPRQKAPPAARAARIVLRAPGTLGQVSRAPRTAKSVRSQVDAPAWNLRAGTCPREARMPQAVPG